MNFVNIVLMFKLLGVKDLMDFDFMDFFLQDIIFMFMFDLWVFGVLDNLGELMELGCKMSVFFMDFLFVKMFIMVEQYGCSEEMVIIVFMFFVFNVFY